MRSRSPRQVRVRLAAAGLGVLLLGAGLWWGIHPPRTEQSYREESTSTLELLRSNVETARLWLDAMAAGDVTAAAAQVALAECEDDADSGVTSFASYQPPGRASVAVRTRVLAVGDRVVTLLGDIRIDARAGRWDDAIEDRARLVRLSGRLEAVQRQVAP